MRLQKKTAVITGAANGIGRAMALRFAREGAGIVIADRDREHGMSTAGEILQSGGRALFKYCDVSREEDVLAVLSSAREHFGAVDILVNDAAWQLNPLGNHDRGILKRHGCQCDRLLHLYARGGKNHD